MKSRRLWLVPLTLTFLGGCGTAVLAGPDRRVFGFV
jgi:hypothetical protein